MKSEIQQCIEIHKQYAHCTPLANTIGDGFLYKTSPLFKRVRDLLMSQNYVFKNELSEDSRDYFMTHLFQLDTILFEKKHFARQNYPALEKIDKKFPHISIQLAEVTSLECYSALLHDSVHCLCQQYFKWPSLNLRKYGDQNRFLQELIAAESIAITIEFLTCIQYSDPAERALAYMNALGHIKDADRMSFDQLAAFAGSETAIEWLFRGYFAGNYFYEASAAPPGLAASLTNKSQARDPRFSIMTEAVLNIGFGVNKPFRNVTAQVFFKLIGVDGGLKNAMTFDLHAALTDGSPIMSAARDLIQNLMKPEEELYATGC